MNEDHIRELCNDMLESIANVIADCGDREECDFLFDVLIRFFVQQAMFFTLTKNELSSIEDNHKLAIDSSDFVLERIDELVAGFRLELN